MIVWIERLELRALLTADLGFAATIGGIGGDGAGAIAADRFGNVYATGQFSQTCDFDSSAAKVLRTAAGDSDAYVAKYNSQGKLVWVVTVGGGGADDGMAITTDSSGNVFVGGFFNGAVDFDPGPAVFKLASAGMTDAFLLKLNPSGSFQWARQFAGVGDAGVTELACDSAGNVHAFGMFTGSIDLNPSAATQSASSRGGLDVFLTKLDAAGNFVFGSSFGGGGTDFANGIAIGHSGQIAVAGSYFGTVDLNPGSGVATVTSAGDSDVYISHFNSAGGFVRGRSIGGGGADICGDITFDSSGGVVAVGGFSGTADFNPSSAKMTLTSAGGMDAFVLRLDASGNFAWAKRIGGAAKDRATDIAHDVSGNLFITGQFAGSVDFDPSAGVTKLYSANGTSDGFIMKLSSAGNFAWARRTGGAASTDITEGVALASSGGIFIAGRFRGTIDFDPGSGTKFLSSASGDKDDGFLVRLINT